MRRILTVLVSGPVEDLVAAVLWSAQYLQDALNLLHDAIVKSAASSEGSRRDASWDCRRKYHSLT